MYRNPSASFLCWYTSLIKVSICHKGQNMAGIYTRIILTSFQKVSPVDEEVQRASLRKLDSLSDDVVEMVRREVIRHQVPKRQCQSQEVRLSTYLVLSISGSLEVWLFSQITGILSLYRSLILSASAFLLSTRDCNGLGWAKMGLEFK